MNLQSFKQNTLKHETSTFKFAACINNYTVKMFERNIHNPSRRFYSIYTNSIYIYASESNYLTSNYMQYSHTMCVCTYCI
ncbi:hypothetical protein I3843_14G095800 [Carya illinoinensis]|nr:hypothetical protein I3843_14G095800 [Carya illinoinensis]